MNRALADVLERVREAGDVGWTRRRGASGNSVDETEHLAPVVLVPGKALAERRCRNQRQSGGKGEEELHVLLR